MKRRVLFFFFSIAVFFIMLIFIYNPITVSAYISGSNELSVKSCGAKGDGITDDSDAIIYALSQSSRVFFPSGTYHITKQIVIPNDSSLIGENGAILDFHNNITDGYDYGYLVNENSTWYNSDNLAHGIHIENLTIQKSNVLSTEKAILLLSNVTDVTINNVRFITALNDSVNTIDILVNCHNITVTNSSFYHNQGNQRGGLWIRDRFNRGISYGTSNITFKNCYFEKNSGLDELIAIFSVPDYNNNFGCVSNVTIEDCNIVYNTNSSDTSLSNNAPYLLSTSMGDTNNVSYKNCTITNNNLLMSTFKMMVHGNGALPITAQRISNCTINCPNSYRSNIGSYVFYTEGNNCNQETAHIDNSQIYIGYRVVGCNNDINFDNSNFYIFNNGVSLDSNNIARNCNFYVSNCSEPSRVIRNGRCTIINSNITFYDTDQPRFVIQPSVLTNTTINASVPVLVQYNYSS